MRIPWITEVLCMRLVGTFPSDLCGSATGYFFNLGRASVRASRSAQINIWLPVACFVS